MRQAARFSAELLEFTVFGAGTMNMGWGRISAEATAAAVIMVVVTVDGTALTATTSQMGGRTSPPVRFVERGPLPGGVTKRCP